MSDLYNPIFNRNRNGKFLKEKNFKSLISATGGYFLEDEVNEMQAIISDLRKEELRQRCHSGIIENNGSLYFQNNYENITNLFSMDRMNVLINGDIVDINGCYGGLFDVINEKINNIKLPDPPEKDFRYDFVYLEVWLKEINGYKNTAVWANGNENNYSGIIKNDLIDERINGETCRRVQLQWQIRCIENIDFDIHENGFDDIFENGKILSHGSNTWKTNYSFWRSDLNLDGNNHFSDKGLWVAGNGDISNNLNTVDGYSYAIPLFKVFRRNSKEYTNSNIYGGSLYNDQTSSSRPDGKYSDIIYKDDITDLRIYTSYNDIDLQRILNRNFTKLLTNNLTKNYELRKEYFGIDATNIDNTTLVHLSLNGNLLNSVDNSSNFDSVNLYEYVPSATGSGVIFYSDDNLSYRVNTNTFTGRVSSIYKLLDIDDKDFWSIYNNGISIISCSLINGCIEIYYRTQKILSKDLNETGLSFNEFGHIAVVWSLSNGYLYLIVNGALVETLDISSIIEIIDIDEIKVGYNPITSNYCKNVIIDDFDYSYKLNTTFTNLPDDFIKNNAKISIDTQKSRRCYTNSSMKSILTAELFKTSDVNGNIDIVFSSPIGSIVTNMSPRLYHNNESTLINVNWNGLGTNTISCTLTNMGTNVDYNFILVYEAQFDIEQGCSGRPEQIFKLLAEKSDEEFLCSRYDKVYEEYDLDRINSQLIKHNNNIIPKSKLYAYNIGLNDKLGFGCLLKYYISGINGNTITIERNIVGEKITHIYDVNIYDQIDKQHIMETFKSNEGNLTITLSENVVETDIIEILIGLDKNTATYDNISCGITNLYSVKEFKFYADGVKKSFTLSNSTRIIGSMTSKSKLNDGYFAYVNGTPTPIKIEFKDTFIDFTFEKAPLNKSDISIFVNTEYNPLNSERLQVWYNTPVYKSYKNVDAVKKLNNADVIYYNDVIYSITEGVNYSNDIGINKNNISSINLPTINNVDSLLVPTKIMGNATNVKCSINYVVYNDIDYADNVPELLKLKLQISSKKINKGYTGYITVDNKSLYSKLKLERNVPHLNIFPFLIKDDNDKLLMCIITTYDSTNNVYIDANYDKSAFDVFELDKNIIIKGE